MCRSAKGSGLRVFILMGASSGFQALKQESRSGRQHRAGSNGIIVRMKTFLPTVSIVVPFLVNQFYG